MRYKGYNFLQKWPRHQPTHKATYGFNVPPCWKDWKKTPTTPAASNCQTLAGFLQLHPRELDQQPDLPATDLESVPRSRQDQHWLRGLAQWPEPTRQLPLYIFIQLLHRKATLAWLICRSVSLQTKSSRDTSGRPTERCREDSSTSGSNTRTTKGIRKNFWRPVLISFN